MGGGALGKSQIPQGFPFGLRSFPMTFVIGGGGVKRFHLTWDFDGRVGDGFCTMGYIIILDHFESVIFDLQLYIFCMIS